MNLLFLTALITTLLHLTNGEYSIDHPMFLVSRVVEAKLYCLTADATATSVSYEMCDFAGEPANQIWYRTDDETLLTSLIPFDGFVNSNNRCLTEDSENGGGVFISACESEEGRQRFDTWPTDRQRIKIKSNEVCIAPDDTSDDITTISCDDEPRSLWRFHFVSCDDMMGRSPSRLCNSEGCMKAINAGVPDASNQVKVVDEPYADWWIYDGETADAICFGTGLTRLLRDPSLCLQTGDGSELDQDGTQMRVYPCDCNNELQQANGCDYEYTGDTTSIDDRAVQGETDWNDPLRFKKNDSENEYPLHLLTALPGFDNKIEPGDRFVANMIPEWGGDRLICLVQQGDGNFKVLRTDTVEDCQANIGRRVWSSGFQLDLPSAQYYTRMQRDGNLITRMINPRKTVWKTCSQQLGVDNAFSLVYNADETISILSSIGDEIWNSERDESCFIDRPLVLMSSAPGGQNRLDYQDRLRIPDPLTGLDVCLKTQGDGNFVVRRGDCDSLDADGLIFDSEYSVELPGAENYYTKLQRDGNLVTYTDKTNDWVWKTCSRQGAVSEDFSLVLEKDDSISILNRNGYPIWNSYFDDSCKAN